jgi:hypothetical protein
MATRLFPFSSFTRSNCRVVVRAFITLSLMCLLIGCGMLPKQNLANTTTDYNKVVEKAQNEMLLLNIVRASKRHPMYFTDFNLFRGSVAYDFQTGGITIPFGRIGSGLDGSYSVAPNFRYSTNPTFDLAVLNTQEFTRGIMDCVPVEQVAYYWRQGWPRYMLLYLLVERIEARGKKELAECPHGYRNGEVCSYKNDPDHKAEFKRFQDKLAMIIDEEKYNEFTSQPEYKTIGPKIEATNLVDLKDLVEAKKAGLTLRPLDAKGKPLDEKGKPVDKQRIEYYQLASATTIYALQSGQPQSKDSVAFVGPGDSRGDKGKYTFYIRSPEAILYYLGEIVREQTRKEREKPFSIKVDREREGCKQKEEPLFVVHTSTGNHESSSVAVDYDGTRYSIPRTDSQDPCVVDRSMQVLSFVAQLIGLQKKGEKPPVTGVVTTIGR